MAQRRGWRRKNLEKLRKQAWVLYRKNIEKNRAWHRAWKRRQPKKPVTPEDRLYHNEACRRFRKRHRARLLEEQRQRMRNDPAFALSRILRGRVQKAVKKQATKRAMKTAELIGCSVQHLLRHLASQFQTGMDWQNMGRNGWHIDHVIPCAAFDLSRPDHQRRCFHFTNLRPVWEKQNMARGSKVEGELPLIYRHHRKA